MRQSRIQAVDHVSMETTAALEPEVRWLYTEVALLDEVPCSGRDHVHLRFRSERLEVRMRFVDTPAVDPVACRVTIAVPSLAAAIELLKDRSVDYEPVSGINHTDRRIQLLDPTGHRMELKQAWPSEGV